MAYTCTQTVLYSFTSAKHRTPAPFRPPASPTRHARFVRLFEPQKFPIDYHHHHHHHHHHSLSHLAHCVVASLLIPFALRLSPNSVRLLIFLVHNEDIHFSPAPLSKGLGTNLVKKQKKIDYNNFNQLEGSKKHLLLTCSWVFYGWLNGCASRRFHRRNAQISS